MLYAMQNDLVKLTLLIEQFLEENMTHFHTPNLAQNMAKGAKIVFDTAQSLETKE